MHIFVYIYCAHISYWSYQIFIVTYRQGHMNEWVVTYGWMSHDIWMNESWHMGRASPAQRGGRYASYTHIHALSPLIHSYVLDDMWRIVSLTIVTHQPTHPHTPTHTHTHSHTHTHTHSHAPLHTNVFLFVCTCVSVWTYMRTCVVCAHVSVCVYLCTWMCVCVCVCFLWMLATLVCNTIFGHFSLSIFSASDPFPFLPLVVRVLQVFVELFLVLSSGHTDFTTCMDSSSSSLW